MNLAPNFGFANMGYLLLLFERTFHKDLKIEKKVLKHLNPIQRYKALKLEFHDIMLLEMIKKNQILKRYISENVPLFAQVKK